jgi:capsular polysaccharide biosynthesis protein
MVLNSLSPKNRSINLEYYWRSPNVPITFNIWDKDLNRFKIATVQPFDDYFELYLARIKNPQIDAVGNIRVSDFGDLSGNSFHRFRDISIPRMEHQKAVDASRPIALEIDSECLPLVLNQPGSGVYGHILIDIVPKILLAQKLLNCTKFPLIITKSHQQRLVPVFEYFGIDPKRMVDVGTAHYSLREIIVVSSFIQGVNSRFPWRDLFPTIDSIEPRTRLIWLSRNNLPQHRRESRLLTNRIEIEIIAQDLGFELIYPEEKSLQQMAQIFQQARIVAGESGSALHNVLLGTSKSLKIFAVAGKQELINQIAITSSTDSQFFTLIGETTNSSKDFFIDSRRFVSAVDYLL